MSTSMTGSVIELKANLALVRAEISKILQITGGKYKEDSRKACKMMSMKAQERCLLDQLAGLAVHGVL